MGGAKLPLKCIANEKARKTTLMQRRKGLIKKVSAFSTEFGADAGLNVYDSSNGDTTPTMWPHNSKKVLSIIENCNYYQKTRKVSDNFDLEDFFKNKMSKLEAETSKAETSIFSFGGHMAQSHSPSHIDLGSKSHHDHQVSSSCSPDHVSLGSQSPEMPEFDPDFLKWLAMDNEPLKCAKEVGVPENPPNQVGESLDWASQVCDTTDGVMQDIELVDWDSLPGLLDDWDVIQPDQSHSVPSQIMQQEEILHALPPMDKFQDNSPQI